MTRPHGATEVRSCYEQLVRAAEPGAFAYVFVAIAEQYTAAGATLCAGAAVATGDSAAVLECDSAGPEPGETSKAYAELLGGDAAAVENGCAVSVAPVAAAMYH